MPAIVVKTFQGLNPFAHNQPSIKNTTFRSRDVRILVSSVFLKKKSPLVGFHAYFGGALQGAVNTLRDKNIISLLAGVNGQRDIRICLTEISVMDVV
jgi:hypothetical protein